MAHPDQSYRLAALYRLWRNGLKTDQQIWRIGSAMGCRNTVEIWLRGLKPEPQRIQFVVIFYGRKHTQHGVFYSQEAMIEHTRKPTSNEACVQLNLLGYNVRNIESITQVTLGNRDV